MTNRALEAIHLIKSYSVDSRKITVLDDVNISISTGKFIVIEGSSGSGKSTLLSLLSGLDKPDSGRIIIEGTDITELSEDSLAPFRNQTIGFVFQSFYLIPSLTAYENILFPSQLSGNRDASGRAKELLARVDLMERMNNFPHQLSGGEKQRIAICRALINNPSIIFADEPTGNLDSVNSDIILSLLLEMRKELQTTLILATHSKKIALKADQKILLLDGKIDIDNLSGNDS